MSTTLDRVQSMSNEQMKDLTLLRFDPTTLSDPTTLFTLWITAQPNYAAQLQTQLLSHELLTAGPL